MKKTFRYSLMLAPAIILVIVAATMLRPVPNPWQIPYTLKPIEYGSLDWGDYDGDGDLDVLVTGRTSFGEGATRFFRGITRVYRADDSTFTTMVGETVLTHTTKVYHDLTLNETLVVPVRQSAARWGDYDGDGDLDMLVTGITEKITVSGLEETPISRIYINENNSFSDQAIDLSTGVYDGEAAWGDYDADGDFDIAVIGASSLDAPITPVTRIFRNDGNGVFTALSTNIPGLTLSSLAWSDYDSDGDLDLTISGSEENGHFLTAVYRNDGGDAFTPSGIDLPGLAHSAVAWGDYDGDGDPDLVLSGGALDPQLMRGVTQVYRNDGGVLTNIDAKFEGWMTGKARWGDWDLDGDLDLLLTGQHTPTGQTILKLYLYDGSGFVESNAFKGFSGISYGDIGFADYNGDGDLDVITMGKQGDDLSFRFFMNRLFAECTDPNWVPDGEVLTCS